MSGTYAGLIPTGKRNRGIESLVLKREQDMTSLLQDFGRNAQRLARNPLGIIALFIVLLYGIAGLVLGVSSGNLEPSERQPLIWFLVVFPVVVLAVFYRLVTAHHVKLYAPHDFPDSEGFFRALTPGEQRERLNQEIREMEAIPPATEGDKVVALEMEGTGIKEQAVRHAWVLAEEFAFRELESEFNTFIQRQGRMAAGYAIDGILLDRGRIIVVELKFTRRFPVMDIARSAAEHLRHVADTMSPTPSFILAIVVEGLPREKLPEELARVRKYLKSVPFPVDLRVYDFDELKEKYGVAGERTQQGDVPVAR